ncbi:chromosome replication/partitioning protein (plasmid) [Borrelia miyamotoi]|uniref:Chromosome replication/partitioning protein n=1 Tax=Borrelia miyamotoi TaxID=47466 RepID=A0A481YK76_9SPIR|nr:chromosome replication/partitioning protein [Borrelia miyamotoi]QBK62639.1 chromosome replication/partitioning protein [Borrelia miyamotoi]QBK65197.1 chromosome replication/partitioning protein [Borrelia miyamotoi]WCB91134.1 chromosome replication/partitioning protein [Borrelia miyamotoi]WDE70500.1 chromosome replication/partitioning protein [Borrelia miyamotoi]WDE71855.1 chromosome replication/partitioning protein [Borrelia miyamotoi]
MKDNKELKIHKRNIDSEGNALLTESDSNEESMEIVRYSALKKKLYINLREGIYNRVECMKILKEIKDNEYYKLDGYKSFDAFIKNYDVAKTQAYNYLKIATALEEGLLEEQYILENGFRQILSLLKDKGNGTLKKSRQNPIKPLRFQLKSQESYDFYKKNAKFTSFLMDKLFQDNKDLLEKFLKEFKSSKG